MAWISGGEIRQLFNAAAVNRRNKDMLLFFACRIGENAMPLPSGDHAACVS